MSFEGGPPRPTRRWAVRLFETSDKLEEHLNRSNLRPDQVVSVSVDADGFFVLVYHVGGPPPGPAPGRAFSGGEERRPPPRRFEDDAPDDDGGDFRPRRGGFDRGDRPGFDRGGDRGGGFNRGGGGGFRSGGRSFGGDRGDRAGLPPRRTPRDR
jgi:hypothetical protein